MFSSGVCAAMARKLLQGVGYVPSVEAGLWLTAALALAFAAAQLAYLGFMRLTTPSRATAPLLFESVSNAAAILLLPYLAGLSFIPLLQTRIGGTGAAVLEKLTDKLSAGLVEPALLTALFLMAHAAFKILSFFSATESRPAGRGPGLLFAAAAGLCVLTGIGCAERWVTALDAARQVPLADPAYTSVDGVYANARALPLGADLVLPLEGRAGQTLSLGWARADNGEDAPAEVFVTVRVDNGPPAQRALTLAADGWTTFRPLNDPIPDGATRCILSWDNARDTPGLVRWGIRRPPSASETLLVAGPSFAQPADAKAAPNFVIIGLDGVTSSHLQSQGYNRMVLPVLENLAKSATFFPACVPPAPEATASYMTLLTGRSPLEHGFLGKRLGPLASTIKTLPEHLRECGYTTAAFTEADWRVRPDLGIGTGFERGFDTFDPTTPLSASDTGGLPGAPEPPEHAGSGQTLEKAAAWVDAHAQERFFLFVRLREAGAPAPLARYGEGFIAEPSKPAPDDVYDTALAAVDKALPAFLDRLSAKGLKEKTVIVIASPFGLDPYHNPRQPIALNDQTVMTPLLLIEPGKSGTGRNAIVSLADVAPTLLHMLSPKPEGIDGQDLREYAAGNEEVSMAGDPLVLSVRNKRWRFTWDSGLDPFTRALNGAEAAVCLINVEQSRARMALVDDLVRFPEEVARAKATLLKYLENHRLVAAE